MSLPSWELARRFGSTPTDLLVGFGMVVPPVNVFEVARLLGVEVRRAGDPGWSAALAVRGGVAMAWVDGEQDEVRQRFALAHSLGHLLLHDVSREIRDDTFAGSTEESAANCFAADLIMPMWMLGPLALTYGTEEHIGGLAELFGVTIGAMRRRVLESFGVAVTPL